METVPRAGDAAMLDKLKQYNRIAFVASGGAAKAMFYHIGVTLALKEYGIEIANAPRAQRNPERVFIEHIIGSSGGSIFGALMVNDFDEETIESRLEAKSLSSYFTSPDRRMHGDLTGFSYADIFSLRLPPPRIMMKYLKRLAKLPYMQNKYGPGTGIEAIMREIMPVMGLFTLERLEKYLEDVLPINDFEELYIRKQVDLSVIATEIDYPRKAIFGKDMSDWIGTDEDTYYRDRYLNTAPISRAVHASCCVPGLFKPVSIDGHIYYDGEVKQCLSVHVAADMGADLIFVSHTFTPYVRDENMGSITELGLYSLVLQAMNTAMYQKIREPAKLREQKEELFAFVRSPQFRNKYKLSKETHEVMVADLAGFFNFNKDRKYIYIPSPNEIFFVDHFNILPYSTRELINIGYSITNEIMPLHGFEKLEEYKTVGILEAKNLNRFKFKKSRYERYRQIARETFPKLQ
jgi:predicted acylesterase/phospholipase RssA